MFDQVRPGNNLPLMSKQIMADTQLIFCKFSLSALIRNTGIYHIQIHPSAAKAGLFLFFFQSAPAL